MQSRFDLNAIRDFAAVAAAGSMSGASASLGLPTSTISRSISRLEKQVGVRLFRRNQSGVLLTDAGKEYLPSCLKALSELEDGERALRREEADLAGTLRVISPITTARELLAPLIPEFSSEFPGITLEIATYAPGMNEGKQVNTDILLHVWPLKNQDHPTHRFRSVRRGIYASTKCVQNLGEPQSPEDLKRFPVLGSHGEPGFRRWHLRSAMREVDLDLDFRFGACDPEMLRAMIVDGLGVSTLPVWLALRPGTNEYLVRLLPEWEPCPVPLLATCLRNKPLPLKISRFFDFLEGRVGTALDPRAPSQLTQDCFTTE